MRELKGAEEAKVRWREESESAQREKKSDCGGLHEKVSSLLMERRSRWRERRWRYFWQNSQLKSLNKCIVIYVSVSCELQTNPN